jgi:hypothetical protein
LGSIRNDFSGWVGMQFQVGASNIRVSSLARWVLSGNSQTHVVKLVDAASGASIPNGFVTVNCAGAPTGAFRYQSLSSLIVLAANQLYYLVSEEVDGGDAWGESNAALVHTADATVPGAVYGTGGTAWFATGSPDHEFVPVDFQYAVTSDPPTTFRIGSLYPPQTLYSFPNSWAFASVSPQAPGSAIGNAVGLVTLFLYWRGGSPNAAWSGTLQYFYDNEIPIGSPVHDSGSMTVAPLFVASWDTTTVPDGTHVLYARFIDAVGYSAYNMPIIGTAVVIHNSGFVNGAQDVWVVAGHQNEHRYGGLPDKIRYSGVPCPANNSYLPYSGPTTVPPATSDSRYTGSNAALLRDHGRFIIEMSRAAGDEWEGFYRWASQSTDGQGGAVGTGGGAFAWVQDPHQAGISVTGGTARVIFSGLGFDGNRFDNYTQAGFSNYVEIPDGSGWYGVDLSGRVFKETHAMTTTTLAGPRLDRTKTTPPYADIDGNITVDDPIIMSAIITRAGEYVGVFDSSVPGPEYMLGSADICVDPRDHNVLYVASEYLGCIFKVDLNFSPAHIRLYAGQYDTTGFLNITDSSGATNALFNSPRSIQMGPDGTLYVADGGNEVANGNQLIRTVTPDGLNVHTLCGQQGVPTFSAASVPIHSPTTSTPIPFSSASCYICDPRTIRFNSTGTQLIVFENVFKHVRKIDLVAQTVTYIGRAWDDSLPPNAAGGGGWAWMDVDRRGTVGPVDDMIFNNPTIGTSGAYRMSADGTSYATNWGSNAGVRQGVLVGNAASLGIGHYGWAISIANTQGRMVSSGTLSTATHHWRIAQPTGGDASMLAGTFDQATIDHGLYIMTLGSGEEWPINCRPSLHALYSKTGMNQTGAPTFDDLNTTYPTSNALAAYIRSGAPGIVPRPELTGKDWNRLEYYIRRYSFSGSYPTPVTPTPDDPYLNLDYPVVTSCTATRLSPTSIRVTWATSKPTIGMAVAGSDVQFAYGATGGAYNVFSPIENLTASTYATSHSADLTGLSPNHTTHFSVLVKDLIGNFGYAADQAIAPVNSPDGTSITNGTGTLVTAHGLWSFGSKFAPTPGWGIGPFYRVLLNGQQAGPAQLFGGWQKLVVGFGGNVYALTFDQLWYVWSGGQWQPNDGADAFSGPAATPTPSALPTPFAGPYAVSPDGTAISGGSGSLSTLEGVWTFGAANGVGWNLVLNGLTVWNKDTASPGAGTPIAVTHLQVNSHGHLFLQTTDTAWHVWASSQPNPCVAGSIGMAVPVAVELFPPMNSVSHLAPDGTLLTTLYVTMSDGAAFTGTLTVGPDWNGNQTARASGNNKIVKNGASVVGGASLMQFISVSQNGANFGFQFDVQFP